MEYQYLKKALNNINIDSMMDRESNFYYGWIDFLISYNLLKNNEKPEENNYELKLVINILSLILHNNSDKIYHSYNDAIFSIDNISEKDVEWLCDNIEQCTDNVVILAKIFDVLWVATKREDVGEKAAKYLNDYVNLLLDKEFYIAGGIIIRRYIMSALSLSDNSQQRQLMFENYKKWVGMEITEKNSPFLRELYMLYLDQFKFDGNENIKIANTILNFSEKYVCYYEGEHFDFCLPFIDIIIKMAKNIGDQEKEKEWYGIIQKICPERMERYS